MMIGQEICADFSGQVNNYNVLKGTFRSFVKG